MRGRRGRRRARAMPWPVFNGEKGQGHGEVKGTRAARLSRCPIRRSNREAGHTYTCSDGTAS